MAIVVVIVVTLRPLVNGEEFEARPMKLEDKEDPVIIPTLPDQHQLLDIRPNV